VPEAKGRIELDQMPASALGTARVEVDDAFAVAHICLRGRQVAASNSTSGELSLRLQAGQLTTDEANPRCVGSRGPEPKKRYPARPTQQLSCLIGRLGPGDVMSLFCPTCESETQFV